MCLDFWFRETSPFVDRRLSQNYSEPRQLLMNGWTVAPREIVSLPQWLTVAPPSGLLGDRSGSRDCKQYMVAYSSMQNAYQVKLQVLILTGYPDTVLLLLLLLLQNSFDCSGKQPCTTSSSP